MFGSRSQDPSKSSRASLMGNAWTLTKLSGQRIARITVCWIIKLTRRVQTWRSDETIRGIVSNDCFVIDGAIYPEFTTHWIRLRRKVRVFFVLYLNFRERQWGHVRLIYLFISFHVRIMCCNIYVKDGSRISLSMFCNKQIG